MIAAVCIVVAAVIVVVAVQPPRRRRADVAPAPAGPPDDGDYPTQPIPVIPAVPAPSQPFTEAGWFFDDWLADQPVDCLSDAVIAMEFRAMTAGWKR